MAKKRKPTAAKLKKRLWQKYFSPFIRLRDALATTGTSDNLLCCTCQKPYPAFGKGCAQAGHFLPGRKNAYLFDERGVNGQCYNCNINLKGNTVHYRKFMLGKYGDGVVREFEDKLYYEIRQYREPELLEMIEKYKQKLKDLTPI